jgi:hypothetical protein
MQFTINLPPNHMSWNWSLFFTFPDQILCAPPFSTPTYVTSFANFIFRGLTTLIKYDDKHYLE